MSRLTLKDLNVESVLTSKQASEVVGAGHVSIHLGRGPRGRWYGGYRGYPRYGRPVIIHRPVIVRPAYVAPQPIVLPVVVPPAVYYAP